VELQVVRLEVICLEAFSKMEQQTEQLDQSIVALTKAIGHQESGGKYDKIGDNGHSKGAYQWNNKTPLKDGEIPANFRSYAHEVGADTEDFSPANQDRVAYKTVEKWGKMGLTPAQIASKWNSGAPDTYKTAKPGYNAEQGVNYDVKAYVDNVAKYYDEYIGQSKQTNPVQDVPVQDTIVGSTNVAPVEKNLKSDIGQSQEQKFGKTAGGVLGAISKFTPGEKLAEGLGYSLNNALGGQEGLIQSNNQNIDIQGKLLAQIKKDKSKGKDTTRLEKALKDLGMNIEESGNNVSDVGTGGITNSGVLKSAGSLATLPLAAYGSTVLGGGGLMGTEKGLSSGVFSKTAENVLKSPLIKDILRAKGITEKIAVESLSRQNALDAFESALKELPMSKVGTQAEQTILKAIKTLNPTLKEKQNLVLRLVKGGISEAGKYALIKGLGNEIGGLLHGAIPK
jgi:hypothetical protein